MVGWAGCSSPVGADSFRRYQGTEDEYLELGDGELSMLFVSRRVDDRTFQVYFNLD